MAHFLYQVCACCLLALRFGVSAGGEMRCHLTRPTVDSRLVSVASAHSAHSLGVPFHNQTPAVAAGRVFQVVFLLAHEKNPPLGRTLVCTSSTWTSEPYVSSGDRVPSSHCGRIWSAMLGPKITLPRHIHFRNRSGRGDVFASVSARGAFCFTKRLRYFNRRRGLTSGLKNVEHLPIFQWATVHCHVGVSCLITFSQSHRSMISMSLMN